MGNKVKKLIAAGIPPHLKDYLHGGIVSLPNKYLFDQIIISALDEVRHDVKSSEIYYHANIIFIGSQGSIIQATGH